MAAMAATVALPARGQVESAGVGWQEIQDVPCQLAAEIPVGGLSVRDLLLLQVGSLVNSKQLTRARVGVHANGSFIAWAEFEVANGRLGVRLTELG
jgi:flagellar motor switch/type III secretory pathway protein FliN